MVTFPHRSRHAPVFAAGLLRPVLLHALARSSGEPGGAPGVRPRILVVEDNLVLAINTEDFLTSAGFDVVGVAASGAEAIILAERHKPSLVVMDIRLPGGADGIDTAIVLLEKHGIRSIFASAHSAPDMKARALSARPVGWLTKPYALADLAAAIAAALKPEPPPQ